MADERDPHSLGGLKAITGQLMLCYHADFQLIFGCTVLVEGPLEHQTLHYGTTHCNPWAFCLIVFTLPEKRSANRSMIAPASEQLLYLGK